MDPYYYQSYRDYKYFLNIIKNIRNIKLNETEEQYLNFFCYISHICLHMTWHQIKKYQMIQVLNIKLNSNKYRSARRIVNKSS